MLSTEEGGRKTPAFNGYRPAHKVHEGYLTSAEHYYPEQELVYPGETALVHVKLITPELYPHCLWVGKVITAQEGGWVIGRLEITKIHNKLLETDPPQADSLCYTEKHGGHSHWV